MILKTLYFSILLFSVSACDLIDYHPYDGRLNNDTETDINNKNISKIEFLCKNKDTIRFVMISDTQRSYDETTDFVNHFNKMDSIDFIIHGGDISDFGLKREYEWAHHILSKLRVPYVTLIGNHDIIGNGKLVYREMYGDDNFSFIAGNTKFICLNTNALEYEDSNTLPDFEFIDKALSDTTSYNQSVVAMHAPPGNEQFNNSKKDVFQDRIKKFKSLQFCIFGHEHNVKTNDYFGDGILYYGCTSIKKRGYLLFTLTTNNYTYEVHEF